jgi:hypothetical protein
VCDFLVLCLSGFGRAQVLPFIFYIWFKHILLQKHQYEEYKCKHNNLIYEYNNDDTLYVQI